MKHNGRHIMYVCRCKNCTESTVRMTHIHLEICKRQSICKEEGVPPSVDGAVVAVAPM